MSEIEPPVHRIVRQLTPDAIIAELKVSEHSIRAAKVAGVFPARWYAPLKRLCDEHGVPIPLAAFNWLAPDKKPVATDGHAPVKRKGQPAISKGATPVPKVTGGAR